MLFPIQCRTKITLSLIWLAVTIIDCDCWQQNAVVICKYIFVIIRKASLLCCRYFKTGNLVVNKYDFLGSSGYYISRIIYIGITLVCNNNNFHFRSCIKERTRIKNVGSARDPKSSSGFFSERLSSYTANIYQIGLSIQNFSAQYLTCNDLPHCYPTELWYWLIYSPIRTSFFK